MTDATRRVNNGFAGRSDDWTPVKYELYRSVFKMVLNITKTMRRHENAARQFFYVDLHAGVGIHKDGVRGSPILFHEVVSELEQPFAAFICESGIDQLTRLECALGTIDDDRMTLMPGDNRMSARAIGEAIASLSAGKVAYGLILADPNGNDVSVDAINEILSHLPGNKIDVLVNAPSTPAKRMQTAIEDRLPGQLDRIKKTYHQYLFPPCTKWQWILSIHTNWAGFPARFRELSDPAIQQAIRDASALTKREQEGAGVAKLAHPKGLMARMRSTSDIPNFDEYGRMPSDEPADAANDAAVLQLRFIT